MNTILIFLLTSLTFDSVSFGASSKASSLQCPENIKVQNNVQSVPEGWHSWDVEAEGKNAMKSLSSVAVYEGHPSKKVMLAPDNEDSSENFSAWTFSPFGEKRKFPIWIACQYEDTKVIIIKSLLNKVAKCRMDFNENGSAKKVGPLTCE